MIAYIRIASVKYMPNGKRDHVRSISMVKILAILSNPSLILPNSVAAPLALKHFTDYD